ncbi:MAG: mechanosensitive ion channel family protein [Chloroflexi bacterium]|nr:mechanosensitive ion channel family protein [Chloroflexota bacterium]
MNQVDLLPLLSGQPAFIQRIVIDVFPFVVALLVIVLLRWLLTAILLRPLRFIVGRSASDIDDRLLDASVSPLRLAVVGLSLFLVTEMFAFDEAIQQLARTVARAIMVASVFFALVRWFEVLSLQPETFRRMTGWTIPERLLPFLNTVVKFLVIALGAIFVLQELQFDVAALIASLGVIGIGISLASQDTVGNMFGFAAIVTDNPFKVGDFITTPAVTGIVESVGVRATRVRQLDQALVTVPNNLLTNAAVLNRTRLEKRRLDATLNFTYGTSSEQLRAAVSAIRELLQDTENIDPESVIVHFVAFNASSLDVRIICQVLLADWREFSALKESVFLEIMGIVEDLGIDFAFPSRSVYIESLPEKADDSERMLRGMRAQAASQPALDDAPEPDSTSPDAGSTTA